MKQLVLVESMVTNQEKLNVLACGDGYLSSRKTRLDKPIRWGTCIQQEIAELVESTPWKHWKFSTGKIDMLNGMVEIVDVGHFLFSHMLELSNKFNNDLEALALPGIEYDSPVQLLSSILGGANLNASEFDVSGELTDDLTENIIIITDRMILTMLTMNDNIYNEEPKVGIPLNVYFMLQFTRLLKLYSLLDLNKEYGFTTIESFFLSYFAKNALNQIRQDYGYAEGTYNKTYVLDDKVVEDNYIMFSKILPYIMEQLKSGEIKDVTDIRVTSFYTPYVQYMKENKLLIQKG